MRSAKKLDWGDLSLPVWGLDTDWHGEKRQSPMMYSLAEDGESLWFVAAGTSPARMHPQARPGMFLAELWRYDVAEFFIADPVSGRYIEWNLAANGSWWSAEFTAPRVRAQEEDVVFPDVVTHAELSPEGGWMAAIVIPLDVLRARLNYGDGSMVNVTFIADSPVQKFYSAAKLPGDAPNFHQPGSFATATFTDWQE